MPISCPGKMFGINVTSGPPATTKGSTVTHFDLSAVPHGVLPVRVEAHYKLANAGEADLTRNKVADAHGGETAAPLKGGPPGSQESTAFTWDDAGRLWVKNNAGNANASPGSVSWETTPEGAETWQGSLVGPNGSFLLVYVA